MKTLLLCLLLMLSTPKISDYEQGWEDGYCEGYKHIEGQMALCPFTPLCPLPKIDCPEGYRCGYNRGFASGMADAEDQ